MPIEIQTTTPGQPVRPNQQAIFSFSQPVDSYVIGISYWSLQFESGHAPYLSTLELKIHSNQVGDSVYADVSARLDGNASKTGYSIDLENSEIYLSCLALTGTVDPHIALSSAHGIPDGGASGPLQPPTAVNDKTPSIQAAVIGGWSTSFDGNDQVSAPFATAINRFGTSIGISANGATPQIEGQVELVRDQSSWGSADAATIDGGFIGTTTHETGLVAAMAVDLQQSSSLQVEMPQAVSQVAVMLQSLVMSFGCAGGTSRKIQQIGGGTTGYSHSDDDSTVTLDDARAFATDGSHNQDDGESRISLVVFGLPS